MQSRLSVSITGNIYAKWAFSVILKLGYFAPAVSCKYYRKHLRKAGIFCNWEIIYVITAENAARRAKLEGRRRAAGVALSLKFKKLQFEGLLCPLNLKKCNSRERPFPSNHKKHLLRDFFSCNCSPFFSYPRSLLQLFPKRDRDQRYFTTGTAFSPQSEP